MLTGWCLNKNLDKTPNSAFYISGASLKGHIRCHPASVLLPEILLGVVA